MPKIVPALNKALLNGAFDKLINVAFNVGMKPIHPDWSLVLSLGGPAKVAERLGWTKPGSVQRVQNWKHRGIPPLVRLNNPRLFRRKPASQAQAA